MAATTKKSLKIAVLLLFHVGHVVQKRRSALWLAGHNGFHAKGKNERFTAVASRCCQNLKYENFILSSGGLRQQLAPKHVLHVWHALQYNSLTSSAKWQREIYNFKVLTTTWTHNSESFILLTYFNGASASPFAVCSVSNRGCEEEAIITKKSPFPKCSSSIYILAG